MNHLNRRINLYRKVSVNLIIRIILDFQFNYYFDFLFQLYIGHGIVHNEELIDGENQRITYCLGGSGAILSRKALKGTSTVI